MATPTDVNALTISLPTAAQAIYAVVLVAMGIISALLGNMVRKQEKTIEAMQEDIDAQAEETKALEDKMRAERERACEESRRQIEKVRDECRDCREQRQREHNELVTANGKFGGRLSRIEGEHNASQSRC
ncbi:MAG: hypothetical protein AB7I29_06975 [Geobacter sp.]|jgi:F0F1-type ATP synthase membrane subunit b/b'